MRKRFLEENISSDATLALTAVGKAIATNSWISKRFI